jgi:predicted transposase YbfD/YdcC
MKKQPIAPLMQYFQDMKDPRIERNKAYPLLELIVITILAIIAGAEGWEDIETYGKAKHTWLGKFLPLLNGIPKHDVYRRVFNRLSPAAVEQCFMAWIRDIKQEKPREIIAIDGKTVRGSFDSRTQSSALHMVSAWATQNRLVLAQVKTENKSNEITAIPCLLELIALKGCIVTIDAMGCQYKIADQIISAQADFVFALKGNQESLYQDVSEYFKELDFSHPEPDIMTHTTFDVDHGRLERRFYAVSGNTAWLKQRHENWKTIASIGVLQAVRETAEKISTETRYYISSLPPDPELFATAVRSHWGIENSVHYVLDVSFREDASRIKVGAAPQNWACFRKIALTVARSDNQSTSSMKKRVKQLGWSEQYMESLLFHSSFASSQASS